MEMEVEMRRCTRCALVVTNLTRCVQPQPRCCWPAGIAANFCGACKVRLQNALSVLFRLSAVCLSVLSLCAGKAGSRGLRTPVCVNEQVHSCPCTDAPVGATCSDL